MGIGFRRRGKGRNGCLLVPLARIPKRLRFYEDAAKVVRKRMVPNFRRSFERAGADGAALVVVLLPPLVGEGLGCGYVANTHRSFQS